MKVIAGNCILEDWDTTIETATFLRKMSKEYKFDLIYKSSWHKDNRSSVDTWTGPDIPECYEIFKKLKERGFTTLTDLHDPSWIEHCYHVDILQLPAYLCMQTSLIRGLAMSGKAVNIKKGQFLHPSDVKHIVNKFRYFKPDIELMVTERGTCFGYHDLVVDPRSLDIMKRELALPVFVDVGHACRRYGIPSKLAEGGRPEFIWPLAKVAVALGCNIFVEVHPHPEKALCDAAIQLDFEAFEFLMDEIIPIREGIKTV